MLNSNYRQKFGQLGEQVAARFLQKNGYRIIQKNFLIRGGQIDLITMSPQSNLVFVEVKTRQASVNYQEILISAKQLKTLQSTARHFLATIAFPFVTWQLDLIWINFDQFSTDPRSGKTVKAKIKHYQNILEV